MHSCSFSFTDLVLPVVQLTVLDHTVAESEEVEHGLVALVSQVTHLEEGFPPVTLLGDAQQVKDLDRGGREKG